MTNERIDTLLAGPELDALIAQKVMGWEIHFRNTAHWIKALDDKVDYSPVAWVSEWKPSTDIAAAWEVVENWLRDKNGSYGEINLRSEGLNGALWICELGIYEGVASTAPLAICRAALKAALK